MLTPEQQKEMSEILFYFHFAQMAAHAQVMHDTLRTHEEKYEWNVMMKHVAHNSRRMERKFKANGLHEHLEDLSAQLSEVCQLYMTSNNPDAVMDFLKENQL